jgi:hypothetical protein
VAASAAVSMFVYYVATPADMDEVLNARLQSTTACPTRRRSHTPFSEKWGLALRQRGRVLSRCMVVSLK